MAVCVAEPMDLSNVRYIFLKISVKEIEINVCISRLESLIKIVELNDKILSFFFATSLYKNEIQQQIQIVLYLKLPNLSKSHFLYECREKVLMWRWQILY